MGFFQKFPYSDEHQLNLDWILRLLKSLKGGTTGQILKKRSGKDYDFEWGTGGGGGTSDYNDLSNKPSINGVTLSGNKTLAELGITNEIFWATYNTTTSAEVEAAYQAGKLIMVQWQGRYYVLVNRVTTISHNFACATSNVIYRLNLSNNVWTGSTTTLAIANQVHSIPAGGSSGQYLAKSSGTDYDVAWVTGGGGGPTPYASNPAALGTASPGSSDNYSRGDHVHPLPSPAAIGAISMSLIWTNSSPTSDFDAQTVLIDLSSYDFVVIHFNNGIRILPISSEFREYCFQPYGGAQVGYRSTYATSTGVTFDDFYHLGTYNTFTSRVKDNSQAKPLYMYGVNI